MFLTKLKEIITHRTPIYTGCKFEYNDVERVIRD